MTIYKPLRITETMKVSATKILDQLKAFSKYDSPEKSRKLTINWLFRNIYSHDYDECMTRLYCIIAFYLNARKGIDASFDESKFLSNPIDNLCKDEITYKDEYYEILCS